LYLGEALIQSSEASNKKLFEQILDFSRHVAGSCQITAAYVCGDYALGLSNTKVTIEVILIIHRFQPKLMNYFKVFNGRKAIILAVDRGVFEMDVERGFLGEAIAGGLIFPYIPLANSKYLHAHEVKLKKRLIQELLENLVLDFPELSYAIHIKPEYFLYESMLSRARLFPPMIYTVLNFMRENTKERNVKTALQGYCEALKKLEKERVVSLSKDYVRISKDFVDKAKNQKTRFINLLKPAQKALFISMLGVFPKIIDSISQNRQLLARLQRVFGEPSEAIHQIEDPQRYLYVPTAKGLVPLISRVDIEGFACKVLAADESAEVSIEKIGGVLNDAFLIRSFVSGEEKKVVVKRFKDWSSFKWFPLSLWTVGTRTFAVLGRSRLERECAINQLLYSKGFTVPRLLYVNHAERLLFMEYVEGEGVEKVIKRIAESKNAEENKKDLNTLKRVGETFARVHLINIALGDGKPENILVGKGGEIYLLDFEQASRNGDKIWDVAEFLYYAGHYISPFARAQSAETIAKVFIEGYLKAGGDVAVIKKAGSPKYTKVFSVFTFPHVMLIISNICRKADRLKG
jgi:tRNA A-37 threonylcarbamoyl transferase component Bud32